jgi:hypothetical protein
LIWFRIGLVEGSCEHDNELLVPWFHGVNKASVTHRNNVGMEQEAIIFRVDEAESFKIIGKD